MPDITAPSVRKKLIEVSIPLEAINAASAREKSIRHGHPSTLHLWWARRPLAACRAVLFAQLVDDPSSWPDRFPTEEAQDAERKRLHKIIERLVPWEASNDEAILNEARWEIARSVAWGLGEEPPPKTNSKAILDYLQTKSPPVYDPFSGGGSIPLEAQRLGLRAYGSDLNPVAVLIGKALVEIPPKFAGRPPVNPKSQAELKRGGRWNGKGTQGLAEDVRYYGQWMREEAEKRIGHLYPKAKLPDGSDATVIAWLWARTVRSPDPAAKGAMVPLVSSFMLSTKEGKKAWVKPVIDPAAPNGYYFEVQEGELAKGDEQKFELGTKSAKGEAFVCVVTGSPIERKARMKTVHGANWLHYASRAQGSAPNAPLDAYGLVKTMINRWREVFDDAFARNDRHKARNFTSMVLEARNAISHLAIGLQDDEALRYIDAMHQLLKLSKAPEKEVTELKKLYDAQRNSGATRAPAAVPAQPPKLDLSDGPAKALKPWIEVALPHPDVIANRFKEAEFAADLFAVDAGHASEGYSAACSRPGFRHLVTKRTRLSAAVCFNRSMPTARKRATKRSRPSMISTRRIRPSFHPRPRMPAISSCCACPTRFTLSCSNGFPKPGPAWSGFSAPAACCASWRMSSACFGMRRRAIR